MTRADEAFAQAVPERVPAASKGTMNNLLIGAGAVGVLGRWAATVLRRADGTEVELPSKGTWQLCRGDRIRIETSGGGWGAPVV